MYKKSILYFLTTSFVLSAFFIVTGIYGCSDGKDSELEEEAPQIELNKTSLVLEIGKQERLIVSYNPIETSHKGHVWESSASSVATVDDTGMVVATGLGECTIMAKALYGGHTAVCQLMVVEKEIKVTNVSLNKKEARLMVGDELKLEVTVTPENATNKSVVWSTSNSEIASVDNTGIITAKSAGDVTIKATSADGGKDASCKITVAERGVEISKPEFSSITATSASITGSIISTGIELQEVGICYSTNQEPTIDDKKVTLNGDQITCSLEKLTPETTYYVRLYAKSNENIYYGEQGDFTTTGEMKATFAATDIYRTRIVLKAEAPAGVTTVDVCYGKNPNPSITDNVAEASLDSEGKLLLDLKSLSPGTTYYIRTFNRNGSTIEYYNETNVQTIGKDFDLSYSKSYAKSYEENYPIHTQYYEINLKYTYQINIPGTYAVEAVGGGSLKKDAGYSESIYIEEGSGTFSFTRDGARYEYGWPDIRIYFDRPTDLRFTNLETKVCYHDAISSFFFKNM